MMGRWFRAPALALTVPFVAAASPDLRVEPADGLVDRPYTVLVSGVAPGTSVRVEARFEDEQSPPQVWTAVGEFRADRSGRVNSARSPALRGTYRGIVPGGLACSGLPVPVSEVPAYLERLSNSAGRTSPLLGTRDLFTVRVSASADAKEIGAQTITRRYTSPGVQRTEVAEGAVKGLYFEPTKRTGIPVVVISGSGGAVWREQAALLASHGHPALALAQFNYPGLQPSLDLLPVETIGDATRWLAHRAKVNRVALIAVSRGTEAAQIAAAHFPEHVAGLVLFVPSPLVHGGFGPGGGTGRAAWTLAGKPVPFVRLTAIPSREERQQAGRSPPGYSERAVFAAEWTKPSSYEEGATPLDRINVPILAIGAGRDAWWPSDLGAAKIKERMTAFGKGDLVEVQIYPDAGHNISRPGIANLISGYSVHRVSRLWSQSGGIPEATCSAGYDAAARTLRFLARFRRGRF